MYAGVSLTLGPPASASAPVWPPGRPAPAEPGTGSAGTAGATPAVAGWSRWCGAYGSSFLCHSGESPRFQSQSTSRDLLEEP